MWKNNQLFFICRNNDKLDRHPEKKRNHTPPFSLFDSIPKNSTGNHDSFNYIAKFAIVKFSQLAGIKNEIHYLE